MLVMNTVEALAFWIVWVSVGVGIGWYATRSYYQDKIRDAAYKQFSEWKKKNPDGA